MYLTKLIISCFFLFIYSLFRGRLPKWNSKIFSYAFIFSFLGYEMWFSFGLIHGDSARARGSPIPNLNNALINSLGDALVSVAMLDLVIWKYGKKAF